MSKVCVDAFQGLSVLDADSIVNFSATLWTNNYC